MTNRFEYKLINPKTGELHLWDNENQRWMPTGIEKCQCKEDGQPFVCEIHQKSCIQEVRQ